MPRFLYYLENGLRNRCCYFRGSVLKFYLRLHGCKAGKRLRCHTFPKFRMIPDNNCVIGDFVTIGYGITFEIQKNGSLIVGNHVKLTQNILISSGIGITIGDHSIFGENVSIRDGDHESLQEKPVLFQENKYSPVHIGKDVWIGAGSYVLPGSTIPDGTVIGSNSVVLSGSGLKEYCIYAGSPVRFIRQRS
jgi:acetyltransferase-like isoleucine patch superfamily enzyme